MSLRFDIRGLTADDADWLRQKITAQWGAETVVGHGTVYRPSELPGFAAVNDASMVGQITYYIEGINCEIVTLSSDVRGVGVGSALIAAVYEAAKQQGCTRLWVITTNDNLNALRFYQKRGFQMVAVYPDAVERSRLIKPEIPLIGDDGIPIRDEIELQMVVT